MNMTNIEDIEKILQKTPPCGHPGCYNHISHPCEYCGRIQGEIPEPYRGVILNLVEMNKSHLKALKDNILSPKHSEKRKTFVITDTHFNHDKLVFFEVRKQGFEEKIINSWKNTVSPEDVVIHLGDVTWGSQEDLKKRMEYLPGTKILVRGNHDKSHSNTWFINAGFSFVCNKIELSGILFTHMPSVLTKEQLEKGIINIHGHFHNNPINRWESQLVARLTDNHYLLALEEVEYKPINIDLLVKRKFIYKTKDLIEGKKKFKYEIKKDWHDVEEITEIQ